MLSLPSPLDAYFNANARFDLDEMLATFDDDAIVRDEKRTHRGTDAIRAWIREATIANRAIAAPRIIQSDEHGHHVTADVAGTFPGSPVSLTFHFRLSGDCIAELEIE